MTIYIIVIILIILIIFIFIIYLSYNYPGLFLSSNSNDDPHMISHMVGEYDIFNNHQVDEIIENLHVMLDEDGSNTINSVMDVIGYPAYLYPGNVTDEDIYNSNSVYYNERNKYNNLLLNNVSFIYPIILDKLKYITGKKCEYRTYKRGTYKRTKYISDYLYSLPGFHIFKGGSWLGSGWDVASVHIDLQFDKLNFEHNKFYQFDMTDVFSFTIPINLPSNYEPPKMTSESIQTQTSGDHGLYIYDVQKEDVNNILPISYSLRNYKKYKINYDVGKMYIHNGLHYHMISSFMSAVTDDRITIQGHGIYCKNTDSYWIYW